MKLFALQAVRCGLAEREGFEPSVPRKRDNGFRDRPVRPLRHLSIRAGVNHLARLRAELQGNRAGGWHRNGTARYGAGDLTPVAITASITWAAVVSLLANS